MKIKGNSCQEKEPTPTEPVEIKNDTFIPLYVNDKKLLELPIDKTMSKRKVIKKITKEGIVWLVEKNKEFKSIGIIKREDNNEK